MRYHHLGIPTTTLHDGETYLVRFGMHVTDHEANPFGIQWMRFDADSPLPQLVKTVPHIAFRVDDLEQALEGREVIIAPNSPSPGVMGAFIVVQGAPIEFLQIDDSRASDS